MKKRTKKLSLNKETLKNLDEQNLKQANGGRTDIECVVIRINFTSFCPTPSKATPVRC